MDSPDTIDTNQRSHCDEAIHDVVLAKNSEMLKVLIKKGLSIENKSTYDGGTALHRAAEVGSIECATILIENKADVNVLNKYDHTPFHTAS